MTVPAHGYVPTSDLSTLAGSTVQAEFNTAAAYARLRAAHPEVHTNGGASGYWSHALSVDIHTNPGNYNISASEAKALSPVGSSPHEMGVRLNFSGVTPAVAKQFGFDEYNAYTFTYNGEPIWISDPEEPVVTAGNQRIARANMNGRVTPSTAGAVKNKWAAGALGTFKGYVHGQTVTVAPYTSDIWCVGIDDGLYYALAGATWNSTNGLTDLDPVTTPPVATAPVTVPVAPPLGTPPLEPLPPITTPPKAPPVTVTKPAAPNTPTPTFSTELAKLTAESEAITASVSGSPLAGLFAGHTVGRKRAYAAYAAGALLISFGPDLVTYQIITGLHVVALTAWIGFVSSAMLKIGAAFGFVAASNAK